MKIWLNLFWKEWHEQKWKLLALIAIALGVCLTLLLQDMRNAEFSLNFTIYGYSLFAPVLIGMGVSAGEHASGVICFVRAQPVPMRRVATVRWIVGACVLLIPLWSASVVCWIAMYFTHQFGPQSVRTYAVVELHSDWSETWTLIVLSAAGMAACLNLYAWIVAVTVNQRTEFRAGLIGLLVTVAMSIVGILGRSGWAVQLPDVSILSLFCLISGPVVSLGIFDLIRDFHWGLIAFTVIWQLILLLILMRVMAVRYGRDERWLRGVFLSRTRPAASEPAMLGKPRVSQSRALLWLQLRQSIPVCIAGLSIVLAMAVANTRFAPPTFDIMYPTIGCVLALLIGVGSFVSELQPDLNAFWRSRPISPGGWFWFKHIGGLAALVGLFDVPCMVLAWSGIVWTSNLGCAAVFPMLLHLLCYCLAVFAACGVRHSSYSTVLAVCALLAILMPELAEFRVPRFLSFFTMWADAAFASRHIAIYGQEFGYPGALGRICDSLFEFLLPACMLIGAIAIPTSIAAAYLVKRDIFVGP